MRENKVVVIPKQSKVFVERMKRAKGMTYQKIVAAALEYYQIHQENPQLNQAALESLNVAATKISEGICTKPMSKDEMIEFVVTELLSLSSLSSWQQNEDVKKKMTVSSQSYVPPKKSLTLSSVRIRF